MTAPATHTGFVLAGGRSRRMGRDKALLDWGGTTLLDHALSRLRELGPDVRILCGPEARYGDRGVSSLVDVVADAGALGGVWTGLLASPAPVGVFLAVDLPGVPPALLRHLLGLAADWDAVVPISARGPEPLCAVYARGCLDPIRRCLDSGDPKVTGFWPEVRVRQVGEAELRPFGDPDRLFRNVNTPEDYAAGP